MHTIIRLCCTYKFFFVFLLLHQRVLQEYVQRLVLSEQFLFCRCCFHHCRSLPHCPHLHHCHYLSSTISLSLSASLSSSTSLPSSPSSPSLSLSSSTPLSSSSLSLSF